MSRGTTLAKLLNDLRAECRISLNVAHNAQNEASQIIALQRKQEWFWHDFSWPHLRVERIISLQAGQRYYDMPSDIYIDRVEKVEIRNAGIYFPLQWGIRAEHYAVYDSERDVRGDPAQRVRISEGEMLEIWPIPKTNADATTLEGNVKITGIRKLNPLVEESDTADIDDRLLVMHCAAEYLAATGAKDAQVKLDQASNLYLKLRGALMPRKTYRLFKDNDKGSMRTNRLPIAIYKAP